MGGDAEVEDPASVMCQHQKYVEDLEAESRNSEKVHRYQVLYVILQEGPPSLRWRLPLTDQVLAHAGLADVHTEFEQFAVNPGGCPSPKNGSGNMSLRCNAFITMMQTAQLWDLDNPSDS